MKKLAHITALILVSVALAIALGFASCNRHWTKKQRREFAEKCERTEVVDGLSCSMIGFAYDEIREITVRQFHDGKVVDTFCVQPSKESYDAERTRYGFSIKKAFHVNDTFQISVPGHEPYILSDMKMVMHAHYTMMSEGWGCEMGDYKINGMRFDNANPDFVKKGFKYPWEKETPAEPKKGPTIYRYVEQDGI